MADDATEREYRDRDRINVHEEYELRYRTKELGVTLRSLSRQLKRWA
jgi:hypothetical protein